METGKWVAIVGLGMLSLYTLMDLKQKRRQNKELNMDLKNLMKIMYQVSKEFESLENELKAAKQQIRTAADADHSVLQKVVEVFADTLDEISAKEQTPLVDTR
jgi:CII-binding regulator of phage lambda lysogenization HflD